YRVYAVQRERDILLNHANRVTCRSQQEAARDQRLVCEGRCDSLSKAADRQDGYAFVRFSVVWQMHRCKATLPDATARAKAVGHVELIRIGSVADVSPQRIGEAMRTASSRAEQF